MFTEPPLAVRSRTLLSIHMYLYQLAMRYHSAKCEAVTAYMF